MEFIVGILGRLLLVTYLAVMVIGGVAELGWIGYGIWSLFQPFPTVSLSIFLLVLASIFVLFWIVIGALCLFEWILFGGAFVWREVTGKG